MCLFVQMFMNLACVATIPDCGYSNKKIRPILKILRPIAALILTLVFCACTNAQSVADDADQQTNVTVRVDFSSTLQDWDGFGVTYVELAQSIDPITDPQEYGGLSRLKRKKRREVLQLIFGADGLQPNIVKMFLDPHHQKTPGGEFDHEATTRWMRYFVQEGIKITKRRRGPDIAIITTLYGPPAWATSQKILRGRDLDPDEYANLANYMIDWVKFLVKNEDLPVKYLSLHNEGDSPNRWPKDGNHGAIGDGHDYNVFWRPHQVAYFLEFMPSMIRDAGLDIGLTPGETTYWRSFAARWYHWAIHDSEIALRNMALITSHGFGTGNAIDSRASDLLRMKRPELHAWTTSMTWGGQDGIADFEFVNLMRRNIYEAKVNALVPWAVLQTDSWVGGDPNPGTAIFISDDGEYEIRPQFYYYKQLARFGQRGMKVATVETEGESGIELIGFASNGTDHPDAFVLMNLGSVETKVVIEVKGSADDFSVTRTSDQEQFVGIGQFDVKKGKIAYVAPAGSVSTFVAN